MAIIITTQGKQARKIEKLVVDKEDYVQQYIYNNPEAIPLYDIREDIKLLILAREFPTDSGPIDALGVDKEGEVYIVETKLFKNPDKRTVVAQSMDYGASLWKNADYDTFIQTLESHIQKEFKISLSEKLKTFFNLTDEEVVALLGRVKSHLDDGSFRFVVLMDQLESRLKDLILYVNQNSQFNIYAVELEYYHFEQHEIVIPKIYGAEVKKEVKAPSSSRPRRQWDKDSLFRELDVSLDRETAKQMKDAYVRFERIGDRILWGTGTTIASYGPIIEKASSTKSLLSVFSSGKLMLKLNWFTNSDKELEARENFRELLERHIPELPLSDYKTSELRYELQEWLPHSAGIIKAFEELKEAQR
ncbi:hypothetical protein A3I42_00565 [Candidatus Uhrbacteria bacterium RIFCSPLOWO2_02_FULL_49_11]|uniref:DUF91 domain-containing protein n=1 Tax=Candidatus Uhrbacteria bacterium RIFCSPLOWO2_02_FULL_49_11 TaxID=1802409 RepID=A0A1F7VBN2_9BACT|nr:MAG: hypothetical protein A3I42_00565 [Candidatus Uhrbacteria bacterium RIFCSPLOWO2_02_FULL_49_11]